MRLSLSLSITPALHFIFGFSTRFRERAATTKVIHFHHVWLFFFLFVFECFVSVRALKSKKIELAHLREKKKNNCPPTDLPFSPLFQGEKRRTFCSDFAIFFLSFAFLLGSARHFRRRRRTQSFIVLPNLHFKRR